MRRVVAERDAREKKIQNHVERQSSRAGELENCLYARVVGGASCCFFGVRNYSLRMSCVYKHMPSESYMHNWIEHQQQQLLLIVFPFDSLATKTTNFVVGRAICFGQGFVHKGKEDEIKNLIWFRAWPRIPLGSHAILIGNMIRCATRQSRRKKTFVVGSINRQKEAFNFPV